MKGRVYQYLGIRIINPKEIVKMDTTERIGIMTESQLEEYVLKRITAKEKNDIKELLSVCKRFLPIGPYLVPVASLPYTMSSDAGHIMAEEFEEGKVFAACYSDTATHRLFSLRSCPGGVDVSAVAKEYGGGGHNNAAGFRVGRDHILARS